MISATQRPYEEPIIARQHPSYAAVFIDFENVYYHLRPLLVDEDRTQDISLELIRSIRDYLASEHRERCIIQHAYADFEQLEVNAQGQLYLIGIDSHNVLGTEHKNAADMRLCIDVLETLYTRPEIKTFIFVAGDRDYIPVIQHLKKHAKTVRAVAFEGNVSGDLRMNVGDGFINAMSLLSKLSISELEVGKERRAEVRKEEYEVVKEQRKVSVPLTTTKFERVMPLDDDDSLVALEILLQNYGDKPEVWFSPFLNKLRQSMQHLAEYERKSLITTLADYGAVKVEKRRGEPNDYSVLIVNWNHPDVQALNPGGG